MYTFAKAKTRGASSSKKKSSNLRWSPIHRKTCAHQCHCQSRSSNLRNSSNSFGWTLQTEGLEFLSNEVALHQGGLAISNQVSLTLFFLALLLALSVPHQVLLEGNGAAKQLKPITTATTGKSQGRNPGRSAEATSSWSL